MPQPCNRFFLTGPPRSGKSTLMERLVKEAQRRGVEVTGFFTPEVREGGKRIGFDIQVINGPRVPLARKTPLGDPSLKFAGYFLNPEASNVFTTMLPKDAPEGGMLVLDEIGPMEIYVPGGREYFVDVLISAKGPLTGVVHRRLSKHDAYLGKLVTARSTVVDLASVSWSEAWKKALEWLDSCTVSKGQ